MEQDPVNPRLLESGNAGSDDFFAQTDVLQKAIAKVTEASKRINDLKIANIATTDSQMEKKISMTLGSILEDNNKEVKSIRDALKRLKEQTDQLETEGKMPENKIRIRRNQHSTLTRQFVKAIEGYQKAQQDYEDEIKAKVSRQIRIVDPTASDEKINEIFQTGDPSSVIKQAIVGPVNSKIEETYREVQDKYRDVIKLVKSVHELNELFQDMAVLVHEQGEILDRIETNVKGANQNIKSANEKLDKALEHQKAARKARCCIIICVIVLIVIVGLFFGLL